MPLVSTRVTLLKPALQQVFENLREAGFTLVGPTVCDGAIVLEEIQRLEDLPIGWTDEQAPGSYRLRRDSGSQHFDYNCGPQSWKKFLNPPQQTLLSATKINGTWEFRPSSRNSRRYALIGVRACELHAIAIQDCVFANGDYQDPLYTERRRQLFVLAVNCSRAAPTCFCTSMKTGPRVSGAFDLALTETTDLLVAEVGSEAGSHMLRDTGWEPASAFDLQQAAAASERAEQQMRKRLETYDLPRLLYDNLEHPRWDEVAARCLSCANCTMVCPTCFCSTVEDTSDLRGENADRVRVWDSCFVSDFSHVHGGNIRPTVRARYRQWLSHKFASWIDQFGISGCVGCGRCITWCPVGIDVTEEIAAMRRKASP